MSSSVSTLWIIQPRTAWRICLGAGLVILILTFMSGEQSLAKPCGGLAENYAPIIAFELARSEADLQLIFGPSGAPCRETMIARMDSINWLDVLVFIPAYGTFLIGFFLGMRARNVTLASLGVKLSIAAIITDYMENLCLMLLTPQLDAASVWLALLPWATGAKWLALGAAAAVAGLIFIGIRPRKGLVVAAPAALICWVSLLVTIAALASPAQFGAALSPAIGASWVVFLITAFTQAVRSN
jgi:hypothetical protein